MTRGGPSFSAADQRFMRRALALAERGRGTTRPNPVVGAVVVRAGRVIAEGFHARAGEAHAEVNAFARLKGGGARGATLYVTLEPCSHTGRTGPCTEVVAAAGVARVVVGCRDPNPLVDGRGIRRLRRAGIRVDVGCLEADCQAANRAYAVWIREHRPLVTLKAAATLDGYIADAERGSRPKGRRAPAWITGPEARRLAHELRAAHDAVLVGSGTVIADDPRLTVRRSGGRSAPDAAPLRVVLVGGRRLPTATRILRDGSTAPTEVITGPGRSRPDVRRALRFLAKARQVQSVLVEGGATIHGALIAAGMVDRVAIFVAPRLLGGGVPIARGADLPLARALALGPISIRSVGRDLLLTADVVR